MEKNSEVHLDSWVDDRLATLNPNTEWRPNLSEGMARLEEQRGAGKGRRLRWTWAAAVAMAVFLGVLLLPGTRVLAQRCVGACAEAGIRLWQGLSKSGPVPAEQILKGSIAPDFTLNDYSGKPLKLSDFRGKVVLLNFWATWCAPCRVEIPWFIEFQRTYGERDFVALGVALDDDGWKSVKAYMDENRITYPIMIGNEEITALYGGIAALPTTLIIDRFGRIASAHTGLVNRSDYSATIETLLKK